MFWIVSGKPGSTKTSHTLDFVLHDKRFKDQSGQPREVYYRGINELKLPWHELDDNQVQNWPDLIPDGAVLVVDEAQQIWPVRSPSKPVPLGLTALETHRHHGWDIIFISQDPSLLDNHARKICNEHFHFSRPFGSPFVIRYHSGSGFVNPSSKSELESCVQTKMRLPKRVFGLYKSAEVHTHKFQPPKMLFIIPVLAVVIVLAIWLFYVRFTGGTEPVDDVPTSTPSSVPFSDQLRGGGRVVQNWGEALRPEVAGLPYTAPFYADLSKPTQLPRIRGCMSFEADYSDCSCFTQQGTKITDLPAQACKSAIKNGVFDPFDAHDQEPISGWRFLASDSSPRGSYQREQ